MEIKEMIRKVYQKGGVQVDDDFIEYKMKSKKRVEQFIKIYQQEKIDSMNYILGKAENNLIFTEEEIEICSTIDLFDRKLVNVCRIIYENRNNKERLKSFMKILEESRCSECI